MEGRINDVKKAEKMAHAGKYFRGYAAEAGISEERRQGDERTAERKENLAGKEYDAEQEADRRDAEKKLKKDNEARDAQNNPEKAGVIPERFNVEELANVGRNLCSILRKREDSQLSPLIEPGEIARLRAGFSGLEEGVHSKRIDEVGGALETISRALDGIGRAQMPRVMREDDDSLTRVIYTLRNLQDVSLSMRGNASENISLSMKLQRISNIVEAKWQYIAKRRDLLRQYTH